MPEPQCACCEAPESRVVTPGLAVAAKAKRGVLNASLVASVGDGSLVADALLGGDPIEESDWAGYWKDIEVLAAYPVSQWVPPSGGDPGYWQRVRTATHTWTRVHSAPDVVPAAIDISYTDNLVSDGFTLDADEAIMPGHTDDLADFGPGYLSLLESDIITADPVGASELESYVADLSALPWVESWVAATVCPAVGGYGEVAAGILLTPGNLPADFPNGVQRIAAKWIGVITPGTTLLEPGVSASMVAAPGLTLRMGVFTWTRDETTPPGSETAPVEAQVDCPWRATPAHFASAADSADPESAGWTELGSASPSVAVISFVGFHPWTLDLSRKL